MFYGLLGVLVALVLIFVIGSLPAYFFFRHRQKANHSAIMQLEFQALLEKGKIDTETYQKMVSLYPLPAKRSTVTLLQIVYIVGSILIGIGAILFIASNWEQMAGWFKLALAAILSFVSLLLGDYFKQKRSHKLPVLGESLILLGSLLWGVVIIFLFQYYQWSVSYNWLLVGIWIVSLLPIMLWMKSDPVFYLIIVLSFIFGIFCKDLLAEHYWIYLLLSIALFFLAKGDRVKEGILAGTQIAFGFSCLEHVTEAITFWLLTSLFHTLLCILRKRKEDLIYALAPLILASVFTFFYFLDGYFDKHWIWIHTMFVLLSLLVPIYLIYLHKYIAGLVMWLTAGYIFLWGLFISNIVSKYWWDMYWGSSGGETYSYEANFGYIAGIILLVMVFMLFFHKKGPFYSTWLFMTQLFLWIPVFLLSTKWGTYWDGAVGDKYIERMNWILVVALIVISFIPIVLQILSNKEKKLKWPYLAFTWFCVAASLASLIGWRDYSIFVINFALLFMIIQSFFWSYDEDLPALFYLGMVALLVFILLRYFDLFWSMMNRSVFFIVGGVLLVGIAVVIERQRHRLDRLEESNENS